jgi:hypothetical protein
VKDQVSHPYKTTSKIYGSVYVLPNTFAKFSANFLNSANRLSDK